MSIFKSNIEKIMDNFKKVGIVLASFVACTSAQAIDIVTTGDTTLSIGGYIKAEAISNMPEKGDSSIEMAVNQSRINLKTTKMIEGQKVTGFIEGDFYGNGTGFGSRSRPELRLRHAYVKANKFTIGKTWNGQFIGAYPLQNEMLDFFGTGFGTIVGANNIRPDLVIRYTNNGLNLTAQDPVYDDANMPDLVASYGGKATSNISYLVAATARDTKNGNDSDIGLGASLAGKMVIGDGSLHASVFTGEGMGAYSTLCSSGADCDAENGDLVSQTGFSVGYNHNFTEKLRGNVRYGEINVDDSADTSLQLTTANLIYRYAPEIDFGIEWREYSKDYISPNHRPEGQQVEIMAKYTF
ncbi:porin [Psychrobacter phenylpyruvicus]|nr:porin [Psychrobacter phenylpyruvicus]